MSAVCGTHDPKEMTALWTSFHSQGQQIPFHAYSHFSILGSFSFLQLRPFLMLLPLISSPQPPPAATAMVTVATTEEAVAIVFWLLLLQLPM